MVDRTGEGWMERTREQTMKRYREEVEEKEMQARVRNMMLKDIRVALRERGCSPAGPREELVERLLGAIRKRASEMTIPTNQSSCPETCENVLGEPAESGKSGVCDTASNPSADSEKDDETITPPNQQTSDHIGDMFAGAGTRSGYHAIGGVRQAPGGNTSIMLG
mmetsp:Transcript_10248/g.62648  ORF Transcript_10248/g.62648 Transcript_10248/m.62648 type:complete len:165 (+) Transcript_10248:166-660(+)